MIGYDGGTLEILRPLVAAGVLPTFARLMEEGCHGRLRSVYPPVSSTAWASFMTGKNPGKHGVFNFNVKTHGTYYTEPTVSTSVDSVTLWEILSAEGKKVAVLNVPQTYPPARVNGIMMSGLGTPDTTYDFTYPVGLAGELKREIPDYKIDVPWTRYDDEEVGAFLNDLTDLTRKTFEAAKYCMKKEAWDFFMVVFTGPDRIQHRLWHSIAAAARHVAKGAEGLDEPGRGIVAYFSFLDGLIGRLIEDFGEDATVFVLSDHGFGPFHCDIDLNNWLAAEGYLRYASKEAGLATRALRVLKKTAKRLGVTRDLVLERVGQKGPVYKLLEQSSRVIQSIDWGRTKAFCYSSHGIYLNVKGRERLGIVEPGAEYEALRDEIIGRLCALKEPSTGVTVIRKVDRREDIYQGRNLEKAPDLMITEYGDAGYIGLERLSHREEDGRVFVKTAEVQQGVHRLDGFFMAHGKEIEKGTCLEDASLMDFLPTILCLLGIRIPEDVDGKMLGAVKGSAAAALFTGKEYAFERDHDVTKAEKEKMLKRLKDLGYL